MAKNNNLTDFLTDVADAIREKKGTQGLIDPQDFSDEIASISGETDLTETEQIVAELEEAVGPYTSTRLSVEYFNITNNTSGYLNGFSSAGEELYQASSTFKLNLPKTYSLDGNNVIDGDDYQIKSIEYGAFARRPKIVEVVIPNSVTSIGRSAFQGCTGLTSITIPDSVTSIGSEAFYYCSGLTSVTIGNSVTSIGQSAFQGCTGLTSITIPDSVTSIGESAFVGCSGLTSITVDSNNSTYYSQGNCLIRSSDKCLIQGCKNSTIPSGVTSIGEGAFYNISGLTSITIPDSVTSLNVSAFEGCSGLTYVTIGSGVTSIGWDAFEGCSGLTSVTVKATTPPALGNGVVFYNTNHCPIYVPSGSVNAYKTAWSEYADRIQAEVE